MYKIVFDNGKYILVEVADTPEMQSKGLMFRKSLPDNYGMLFSYDEPGNYRMWMKNTNIPLDIIFVDDGMEVKHIGTGVPHCEDLVGCDEPVKFVIEANNGFCESNGIEVGSRVKIACDDNSITKMARSDDVRLLSHELKSFKPIYDEVVIRVKYLVRDDEKVKQVVKRLNNMLVIVYATDYFLSDYYDSKNNNVVVKIPKLIIRRKGILDRNDEFDWNDSDVWIKKIYDLIYNDSTIYGGMIHEIMHGIQVESEMISHLRQERLNLKADELLGIKPKKYTDLLDEKASNIEEIFMMKRRGITKEQYIKSFYTNMLREVLNVENMDFNSINDESRASDMIDFIKENADYETDEYIDGCPLDEDVDEWDRYTAVLQDLSFKYVQQLFVGLVKRLANKKMKSNIVFQFMTKNWDGVKLQRHEVPKQVWGKNVLDKLNKIGNQLEDLGLFKEASMVDRVIIANERRRNIHLDEGPEGWKAGAYDITRVDKTWLPVFLLRDVNRVDLVRTRKNMVNADFEKLKEDIKNNGIKKSIEVAIEKNGDITIIDGTHRLLAAEELGMKEIPVEVRYFGNSQKRGLVDD